MIKSFFKGNIGEGKPYQDIVRLNACAMAAHSENRRELSYSPDFSRNLCQHLPAAQPILLLLWLSALVLWSISMPLLD
jgi:hypothetical protein